MATMEKIRDKVDFPEMNRLEHIKKILDLMQFQSRMPQNPFQTKDEAYESAGCGPHAAMYIFAH